MRRSVDVADQPEIFHESHETGERKEILGYILKGEKGIEIVARKEDAVSLADVKAWINETARRAA